MVVLKILSVLLVWYPASSVPIIKEDFVFWSFHGVPNLSYCTLSLPQPFIIDLYCMIYSCLVFRPWYSVFHMIHSICELLIWLTEFFISSIISVWFFFSISFLFSLLSPLFPSYPLPVQFSCLGLTSLTSALFVFSQNIFMSLSCLDIINLLNSLAVNSSKSFSVEVIALVLVIFEGDLLSGFCFCFCPGTCTSGVSLLVEFFFLFYFLCFKFKSPFIFSQWWCLQCSGED